VVRAVVLYGEAPDPQRYAEHVELCLKVPGATFRHGRVFGAAMGDPPHAYYAEFEWADLDAFKAATRSPEFAETGKDAVAMGKPFTVEFVELET
jgi:hypothetical protein